MSRVVGVVAFLGVVACVTGCGHRPIGELGRTAFTHDDRSYAIVYADPTGQKLLGSDWKLENALPQDGDELEYKKPVEFPRWRFDVNEDGLPDANVEVPSSDLRFVHLKHGGVIFVRSMPLDAYEAGLGLDVLGEHMAEAMSGARWYSASRDSSAVGVERRAAVLTERSQAVTVSGAPGRAFTYNFADVDQLHMNPDSRIGKMELVLLRPGLPYGPERWSGRTGGKDWQTPPLMLVIGYWNLPSRFDEGYADFEGLLQRVAFSGRTAGMQRGPTESAAAPAPASEPAAAPEAPAAAPTPDPAAAPAPAAAPPASQPY